MYGSFYIDLAPPFDKPPFFFFLPFFFLLLLLDFEESFNEEEVAGEESWSWVFCGLRGLMLDLTGVELVCSLVPM